MAVDNELSERQPQAQASAGDAVLEDIALGSALLPPKGEKATPDDELAQLTSE